jgi:hypothetical protein
MSTVTVVHEQGISCPCGAYFVIAIANVQLDYALVPMERPAPTSLIVAPPLRFPRLEN